MTFQIVEETSNANKKYNISRRSVCFKLNDIPEDVTDPEDYIKSGIRDIVQYIADDVHPEDRIGFTFGSKCFTKGDAFLSFKKAKNITFEDVWSLLGRIYQSNSEGFHSDTFRMTMTQVKVLRGCGRGKNYNTFEEECSSRRGIVTINNSDNRCLVRALVVARAYAINSPLMEKIRKNHEKLQDFEADKLEQAAGVQTPEDGATMGEVKKFQTYLVDFKITVYSYGSKGRTVLFEGPDAPLKINLIYHNYHYNVITNLKSAFCCSYYCEACHIPFNTKKKHRCASSCPCCQQTPPCEKTRQEITCDECYRKFRGSECYNKHKAPSSYGKKSLCESIHQCPKCLKTITVGRNHTCGEIYCKICKKHQTSDHNCYIMPDNRIPPTDNTLFIFYDLESRQDELGPKGENMHVPNLCVFQQRCNECIEMDNSITICSKCCLRRQVLKKNPVETFLGFILGVRKAYKRIVVLAHNGQAYDHQFLLKHILENTDLKIKLIMRGTSIIMMGIDNIKFIDSINYFPMALSSLPKAFDLGAEIKKGHFPHLFNTLCNENYEGPLPDIQFYDPDHMTEDARLTLLEWYSEHHNDNFNMERDLVDYCISDVDILTRACLKFRKMFLSECNVCPFTEAVTIASACNLVYRRNFLKPQTIGILPKNGYRNADMQSKIATLWLLYEESQRGINIAYSAKQREVMIDGVKIDGYCKQTRQIFEFHGCYYHGHTCITTRRDEPLHEDPADTLNNRMQRTINKTERLKNNGYEVVEMWECVFRDMLQQNKSLKSELQNNSLMGSTPLDPRDSFFGGRTGNCKMYYQAKPDEKIKYVDVCSLYPWVCKYGKYPVGHPKVFVGEECKELNLKSTNGLIKCKILPPQELYHPVLPIKMNNKLMFVLCRACGLEMNQEECYHSIEERAVTGTWVVDEVTKALEKGYDLLEVYEIWQYEIEQYSAKENVGGLFTEMMNKFIKIKQEASGWPGDCASQEEKDLYIEKILKSEGIQLEFSKIVKNPGLRSLAKLMLNSFWGKFGQRENQPKTTIIRQVHELEELISNPSIDVNTVLPINEDSLIVNYEYKEESYDPLPTVNVVLAAYTTTQARLKLYSYLELLGDRVLYFDTDSVIYVSREGEWDIPTGSCLGEMTDELEEYGQGSYIVAFASGGPKNYSYIVFSPKYHSYYTVCKVKGIRLNYNVLKLINFYNMRQMVTSEDPVEPIHITSMNIRRTNSHQVLTKEETKIYRPKAEKRKFNSDFDSIPYGYKRTRSSSSS